MKRVLYGAFLIISAFILPWWIPVIFSLIGIFYFDNLYEVIFVGLIIDVLYGSNLSLAGLDIVFTISLTIALYILTNVKRSLLI